VLQKDKASYFSFAIKTVISKDTAIFLEGRTCKFTAHSSPLYITYLSAKVPDSGKHVSKPEMLPSSVISTLYKVV
jgi:hypothetical protein